MIPGGRYVIAWVWEGGRHVQRAGYVVRRFHNGYIVALIRGGYECVLDKNIREATPREIAEMVGTQAEITASLNRVDHAALTQLGKDL